MKKIIKITEKQIEDIVRRVIAEQEESSEFYTDKGGKTYRLPQIKSDEDVIKFTNIDDISDEDMMKKLRTYNLTWVKGKTPVVNPLDKDIKWSEVEKGGDVEKNASIVRKYFRDGLMAIARTGFIEPREYSTDYFKDVYNEEGYSLNGEVRHLIENFDEVLGKLADEQLSKI